MRQPLSFMELSFCQRIDVMAWGILQREGLGCSPAFVLSGLRAPEGYQLGRRVPSGRIA